MAARGPRRDLGPLSAGLLLARAVGHVEVVLEPVAGLGPIVPRAEVPGQDERPGRRLESASAVHAGPFRNPVAVAHALAEPGAAGVHPDRRERPRGIVLDGPGDPDHPAWVGDRISVGAGVAREDVAVLVEGCAQVGLAVAVVVDAVDGFDASGVDSGVVVVAVLVVVHVAVARVLAAGVRRDDLRPVAVTVEVRVPAHAEPLVDLAVAVVVDFVTGLGGVRVDARIRVVAVQATHGRGAVSILVEVVVQGLAVAVLVDAVVGHLGLAGVHARIRVVAVLVGRVAVVVIVDLGIVDAARASHVVVGTTAGGHGEKGREAQGRVDAHRCLRGSAVILSEADFFGRSPQSAGKDTGHPQ